MRKIALALAALLLASVLFTACDEIASSGLFEEVLQQYQNGEDQLRGETATTVTKDKDKEKDKDKDKDQNKDPVHKGEQATTYPTDGNNPAQTQKPNGDVEKPTPEDTTDKDEPAIKPGIPDTDFMDFQGRHIRVLLPQTAVPEFACMSNGEDYISSALYKRDVTVEELLNISIVCEPISSGVSEANKVQILENDVISGEARFDMVLGNARFVWTATQRGLYYNMIEVAESLVNESGVLPEDMYEDLVIGGKLFAITGPVSPSFLNNLPVLFCNPDMLEQSGYSYRVLAKAAKNGKWDVSYLNKILSNAYEDRNGDSIVNEYDVFGMTAANVDLGAFAYAAGMRTTEKHTNGYLLNALGNAYNFAAADALVELFTMNKTNYVNGDTFKLEQFANQNTYFAVGGLGSLSTLLRENGVMYEILPLPKMNAEDKYAVVPGSSTLFYSISYGSEAPEATAATLAALAVCGIDMVETLLFRNMNSSDSFDMAELVMESVRYDYMEMYAGSCTLRSMMQRVIRQGETYASLQASLKGMAESQIEKMNSVIRDYK